MEFIDLDNELSTSAEVEVRFKEGCFYVRRGASNLVFDCQSRTVIDRALPWLPEAETSGFKPDFGQVKRHINNGYTPLLRIKRMGVNSPGPGHRKPQNHVAK
ncbi:hypothetical protein [Hymenobacter cellulosilyticus]|uniref:Uncharacterized protein n=1 Tax=Hymenobacter cellulosilyticus TaxID=2932248 RepID=A0A8T9Q3K0_9BACT|nr:hypothetical protein [Hymenobacter cellulosilyticus]UOQ70448.1 hypothetical protein MUN79_17115 [Hymenobacter cellulosilyticus]